MKMFLFIIMILLLAVNGCDNKNYVVINNGDKEIKINVEIADDDSERAKGLMFRESLEDNSGMLFVFEDEDYYGFWMKNTLIPLDMIFISEDLRIIDIRYAVPCEDECTNYIPKEKAKYILEVNGNFTLKNKISIGNKVILGNLNI